MRKKFWYMFCYLIKFYSFNNTCIFPSQKLSNNLLPLPSRSKNQIFLGFSDFILLVTCSLKDNPFRTILLFQKAVHEIHMLIFFLFRAKYICFTAHTFKFDLCLDFYILVRVCMLVHVSWRFRSKWKFFFPFFRFKV